MKITDIKNVNVLKRNEAVKAAYEHIREEAMRFIASIEKPSLRQILEREIESPSETSNVVHELITPILYLSLRLDEIGEYSIHYGYSQAAKFDVYYSLTSAFIRSIYRHTMVNVTVINIESCVSTESIITDCFELFDYIGDRNPHLLFSKLAYKALGE